MTDTAGQKRSADTALGAPPEDSAPAKKKKLEDALPMIPKRHSGRKANHAYRIPGEEGVVVIWMKDCTPLVAIGDSEKLVCKTHGRLMIDCGECRHPICAKTHPYLASLPATDSSACGKCDGEILGSGRDCRLYSSIFGRWVRMIAISKGENVTGTYILVCEHGGRLTPCATCKAYTERCSHLPVFERCRYCAAAAEPIPAPSPPEVLTTTVSDFIAWIRSETLSIETARATAENIQGAVNEMMKIYEEMIPKLKLFTVDDDDDDDDDDEEEPSTGASPVPEPTSEPEPIPPQPTSVSSPPDVSEPTPTSIETAPPPTSMPEPDLMAASSPEPEPEPEPELTPPPPEPAPTPMLETEPTSPLDELAHATTLYPDIQWPAQPQVALDSNDISHIIAKLELEEADEGERDSDEEFILDEEEDDDEDF